MPAPPLECTVSAELINEVGVGLLAGADHLAVAGPFGIRHLSAGTTLRGLITALLTELM